MHAFDQLEWVHTWDDYEMLMYVRVNEGDDDGIYMQILKKEIVDGAEEWNIVYDRRVSSLDMDVDGEPGTDEWEEKVLRSYLNTNPNLVNDEKAYLAAFLENGAAE